MYLWSGAVILREKVSFFLYIELKSENTAQVNIEIRENQRLCKSFVNIELHLIGVRKVVV